MRTENEIRSVLAAHENEETGPNTDELSLAHKTGVMQAYRWVLGKTQSKAERLAAAVAERDRLYLACAEADAALANARHARDGATAAWARACATVADIEAEGQSGAGRSEAEP